MAVGISYVLLDNFDKAIEKHNECLAMDEENVDALNDKGVLLLAKGGVLEPIKCFTKALTLKPDSSMPLNNLGFVYDSIWCYYTAIDLFEKCLKINPLFVKAWYNMGRAWDELIIFESARECYDKAIEIDPNYADAWHNKGLTYHKQKRFQEAIECYNKAIYINPSKTLSAQNIIAALNGRVS
jgi:tetratricopeptide (TPR) repeat protein